MAAENLSRDCARTENGENGCQFDTEAKEVLSLHETESVKEEKPNEETKLEVCLLIARLLLQMVSTDK